MFDSIGEIVCGFFVLFGALVWIALLPLTGSSYRRRPSRSTPSSLPPPSLKPVSYSPRQSQSTVMYGRSTPIYGYFATGDGSRTQKTN